MCRQKASHPAIDVYGVDAQGASVLLSVSRLFNHTVRTVLAKPALLSTTIL